MINAVLTALGRNLFYYVTNWRSDSNDPATGHEDYRTVADVADASVISSQVAGTNLHTVILDIDIPASLVPSSTFGHTHLYIDRKMTWEAYVKLLDALDEAGILEPGYVSASKARGFTAVRLPWIRK